MSHVNPRDELILFFGKYVQIRNVFKELLLLYDLGFLRVCG